MFLMTACFRAAHVSDHMGYHSIGARIIRGFAVTAITAATGAGLTWSGVLVVVVGWVFSGSGCHTTSKGAELSSELDYSISFWLWILSLKYLHFMEVSTCRGYFRISWKYPSSVDIFRILWIYPYFVYIIRILWKYPCSVNIIHIFSVLSLTFYSSSESDWCTTPLVLVRCRVAVCMFSSAFYVVPKICFDVDGKSGATRKNSTCP